MNLPRIPIGQLPFSWAHWLDTTLQHHLRTHKGVTGTRHMTTAERDAIDAQGGDMIYNIDSNQAEVYENGAWRQM